MGDRSKIEWTEATWNPVTGCSPVSEGCENCYARREAEGRLRGRAGYDRDDPFRVAFHPERLGQPSGWSKPRRIFVCSMGDLFHEDVPEEWIDQVFAIMALNRRHTFMVLTKRPERMREYIGRIDEADVMEEIQRKVTLDTGGFYKTWADVGNVWLGVTAENQARSDERIPILLDTPAAVRFVSVEPMLGPVDLFLTRADRQVHLLQRAGYYPGFEHAGTKPPLDWVICGGETGSNARPMHPDWARSLRDQCRTARVAFFFKSWGEWIVPEDGERACRVCGCTENNACDERCWWIEEDLCSSCVGKEVPAGDRPVKFWKVGKRTAGRLLDGKVWDEIPEDGGKAQG